MSGEQRVKLFSPLLHSRLSTQKLFIFSVHSMATATLAKLFKLKPSGRVLFVFRRYVVAFLALRTLQNYIISRHKLYLLFNYSTTSETVPAPTVLPPSLIANLSPFSIAIGAISSISIWMLSPGITISTPVGKCATPVTSVVLK
jgi:hypothetical protein